MLGKEIQTQGSFIESPNKTVGRSEDLFLDPISAKRHNWLSLYCSQTVWILLRSRQIQSVIMINDGGEEFV